MKANFIRSPSRRTWRHAQWVKATRSQIFLPARKSRESFSDARSIVSRLLSRRSLASSSRSAVLSASGGPFPASISARCTHPRSALSVRSKSSVTCAMLRSPTAQSRTASALNSGVNARRLRRFFFVHGPLQAHSHASWGVHESGDFHFGRDLVYGARAIASGARAIESGCSSDRVRVLERSSSS